MPTQLLSKSDIMAYRQCRRRLWLEINKPELRSKTFESGRAAARGNNVGDIARGIFDPKGNGILVNRDNYASRTWASETSSALKSNRPIFEAGLVGANASAFIDIMLPAKSKSAAVLTWHLIEVKSSTSVKDYHLDEVALEFFVATAAKVGIESISIAHIDSSFVYRGGNDYKGLLKRVNLSKEAGTRHTEVSSWISKASAVAVSRKEPEQKTGAHCFDPFDCAFYEHCRSREPQAKYPLEWLPRIQTKALKTHIADTHAIDMRDIPDHLLNAQQLRVKTQTVSRGAFVDRQGAKNDLKACKWPLYFLDFETINFEIPIWKNTRPYQQIPFQFSLHRLEKSGKLDDESFLDLSGDEPSESLANALIKASGRKGTIIVYNAGFEMSRIADLAKRFPRLAEPLLDLNERIFDLLKVTQQRYYHPEQKGSWSIKRVLPTIAPELNYDQLSGAKDGGMAMDAFLEAIQKTTTADRRSQIERGLLDYCRLDTQAMVAIWKFLSP